MSLNGFSKTLLSLAFVSTISLTASDLLAAGQCKGLEKSACIDNQACTWVSSYTTKKGNSVSAYCRAARGKSGNEVRKGEGKDLKTGWLERIGPASGTISILEEKRG